MKEKSFSHVQIFVTPWAVACQDSLSMGFYSQEHWSDLPFSSPGDLPKPGIKPRSPALKADSLPSEPQGSHSKREGFHLTFSPHGYQIIPASTYCKAYPSPTQCWFYYISNVHV